VPRLPRFLLINATRRCLVVAACALVLGGDVSGSSINSSPGQRPGVTGDHHCKCASCRGESSCCCKPDHPLIDPTARHGTPAPAQSASRASGLCLRKVPCGGEGLPTSAPGLTLMKTAALVASVPFRPTCSSRPFAIAALLRHPAQFEARLDEPPEQPAA
jgi:hypothetical protein